MAEESMKDLLKELRNETQTLVRKEVELARAETEEKVKMAKRQAMYVGLGIVLALAGLINVLAVLNRGLTSIFSQGMSVEMAVWLAPLVVSIVLLAFGAWLAKHGIHTLRTETKPEHTVDEARRTGQWAKRTARHQKERIGG